MTIIDDRADACLHTLFEDQARRSPRAPAIVDPAGSLTYEELDLRAELLASYLRNLGIGPDEVVGVYMERSAAYVVACLAALKAGGAFLPLELAYPPSMLNEVIDDSRPRLVLTNKDYENNLPESQDRFCLDEGWDRGLNPAEVRPEGTSPTEPGPENLAFVSYSSGTTGKPKGIANPHRAAVRSYLWRFGLSDNAPGDRVGCNVFFIWEMLRPLLRGATTVVIPDDVIYDPPALLDFLEEYEVTEVLVTPSLLESVLNVGGPEVGERLAALKVLWLNGEVVTRTLARRVLDLLPDTRVMNVYSISETHEVAAGDLRELYEAGKTYCPVGAPLDAEHTYVLDENKKPVPEGEAGELYVGGDCLARGYVNRPEITAQRFTGDPHSPETGARMYRTGDRVRVLPGGDLEVLGRVDFMVKIRGYSIELGAVEAAIERELAVYNSVVVADGEEGADKRLVAYLVPSEVAGESRYAGWELDAGTGRSPDIRNALRSSLPHYAIPSVFVELNALPLQATTGKVDRDKLPEPPARAGSEPGYSVPAVSPAAPRSEKVAAMARLFEEVLRLDEGDVRRDDNFFDVGGHSLAAAELLGRVEDVFGVRLPINVLLKEPTVPGLCDAVEVRLSGESGSELDSEPGPDLVSEAILDADIYPEKEPEDTFILHRARRIFLTGATGFLGAFLLDSLLLRTEATLYCLVRPREDGDLMAPIRANLEGYGLWRPGRARRIVPVAGDLEASLLGLQEGEFDALAREMDVVIHAAARVNLAYPYEALKGANVDGTREVLRLACRHKTKRLHYVSTNGIFPPGGHRFGEDADLDGLAGARNDGYGQTKWVAEKLVRQAALRGLPVSVYRPGNISGHSISGISNPRDFLGAVIAESLRIGAVPNVEGWRVEMTPVDFVSGAICHLANEPDVPGSTFHLAEPDPIPAEEVFGWFGEMGYALEQLSYPDWLEARRGASRPNMGGNDVIGNVLDGAAPGEHELWDGNVYDDSNTRQVLLRTGLRRPDINPALLGNYARHFADRGWVEAPPGDGPKGVRRG